MKLLVVSILALSVVACVTPADPQPEPTPAPSSAASAPAGPSRAAPDLWNAVFLCVNDVTGSCIQIPATFPNAHDQCIEICRSVGNPNPVCRLAALMMRSGPTRVCMQHSTGKTS